MLLHARVTRFPELPTPLPRHRQVTIGDFSRYLRSVGERLEVLERSREASQQRMQEALSPGGAGWAGWRQLRGGLRSSMW